MIVKIILIEKDKITVKKDNVEKVYAMEEFVIQHAKKGVAEISFNDETKKVSFISMQPVEDPHKETKGWEDDIVNFETLLTAAHKMFEGDFSIRTEMLAIDLEKKYALFKATVNCQLGTQESSVFEGHGDATNENIKGDFIKPHFIRMAETRAICRALRWATNNGCAEEEK